MLKKCAILFYLIASSFSFPIAAVPAWSPLENIPMSTGNVTGVSTAYDASSSIGVAVWGDGSNIFASIYNDTTHTWDASPTNIGTYSTPGVTIPPSVDIMPFNGTTYILVAWANVDGTVNQIQYNVYKKPSFGSGSWNVPATVPDPTIDVYRIWVDNSTSLKVAIDGNGTGYIVYTNGIISEGSFDGGVCANVTTDIAGTASWPTWISDWQALSISGELVQVANVCIAPEKAVSGDTVFIAAWFQNDFTGNNITANILETNGGVDGTWAGPTNLAVDAGMLSVSNFLNAAAGAQDGNLASVAWSQTNNGAEELAVAFYDLTVHKWSSVWIIPNTGSTLENPGLAMTQEVYVLGKDGANKYATIYKRPIKPGTADWASPAIQVFQDNTIGHEFIELSKNSLSINGSGNIMASWFVSSIPGWYFTYYNNLTGTWTPTEQVAATSNFRSQLTLSFFTGKGSSNNAIDVFYSDKNTLLPFAYYPYGEAPPPSGLLPPTNLKGKQQTNTILFQKEYLNTLSWGASPSVGIIGYKIYRDGLFIGSVSSLNYTDYSFHWRSGYTYSVTAIDEGGNESTPVYIFIP